jgi:hypothetical protein
MHIDKINRTPVVVRPTSFGAGEIASQPLRMDTSCVQLKLDGLVGADYVHEQNKLDICRGRFIVPIADLSARAAYSISGFFRY